MSRDEARVNSYAERHGVNKTYTDAQALIDDPNVNAVYIATPPHIHRDLVERAARAGKHILLEKPMAPTVKDCEAINAACRKHGVQLIVAYYRRFFPVVQKMKELVDAGAIGRPIRARALHTGYFVPRADGERAWLTDLSTAGGGFMMDAGIHRLDLFAHLMGPARDVAAYADTVHFDFERGIDDSSTVIIRFENGAHATAEFNWNVGIALDELEIAGTRGRLVSRNLGKGELQLVNENEIEHFHLPPPAFTHQNLVNHFVHCLRSGEPNALPGEEGMQATRLCLSAYESSAARKVVQLDPESHD
jgi:predicted dehydrogenase